jgi:hypothetical protein
MKKNYFTLILLTAISLSAHAQQIPNGGFETWTNPKNPDGWYTYSGQSSFVNQAAKDTTSKVEGAASANIQTASVSGQTVYEILSLGTADYVFKSGGVVYTYDPIYFPYRPDTLFFAYKYSSLAADTASVLIRLSKGTDSTLVKRLPLYKSAQWISSFIVLTPLYLSARRPDSLLIQFRSSMASGSYFGTPGSSLNVDAVRFGYRNVHAAIDEAATDSRLNIYPNPAQQWIHTDCPNGYELYTAAGIMVGHSSLAASAICIDHLPAGLYLLKSGNRVGRFMKVE